MSGSEDVLVENFSANLWKISNTIVFSMFALSIGAYALFLTSSDRNNIANIVECYWLLFVAISIFGNWVIVYVLNIIKYEHLMLLNKQDNYTDLKRVIERANRVRAKAIWIKGFLFIGIVLVVRFDGDDNPATFDCPFSCEEPKQDKVSEIDVDGLTVRRALVSLALHPGTSSREAHERLTEAGPEAVREARDALQKDIDLLNQYVTQ